MRIQEVIQQVNLTKRAVKYYEDQGLIKVNKDKNGYRNYTEDDIKRLKEIAFYRKLGISIRDIAALLSQKDSRLLQQIYQQKKNLLDTNQQELEALREFMQNHDVDAVYSSVDYSTIAQAMQDMFPGFYGAYFMNHLLPYLQIPITTPEQQKAYQAILSFWDNTKIKIPLFLYLASLMMDKLIPRQDMKLKIAMIDQQIQQYSNPSEELYQKLCRDTQKNVKRRQNPLFRYHPANISQRKFMKRLQDAGYNDIFIPNMIMLSPKYREYHNALTAVNQRICKDLGLYYDSNYNLISKNPDRGPL